MTVNEAYQEMRASKEKRVEQVPPETQETPTSFRSKDYQELPNPQVWMASLVQEVTRVLREAGVYQGTQGYWGFLA